MICFIIPIDEIVIEEVNLPLTRDMQNPFTGDNLQCYLPGDCKVY